MQLGCLRLCVETDRDESLWLEPEWDTRRGTWLVYAAAYYAYRNAFQPDRMYDKRLVLRLNGVDVSACRFVERVERERDISVRLLDKYDRFEVALVDRASNLFAGGAWKENPIVSLTYGDLFRYNNRNETITTEYALINGTSVRMSIAKILYAMPLVSDARAETVFIRVHTGRARITSRGENDDDVVTVVCTHGRDAMCVIQPYRKFTIEATDPDKKLGIGLFYAAPPGYSARSHSRQLRDPLQTIDLAHLVSQLQAGGEYVVARDESLLVVARILPAENDRVDVASDQNSIATQCIVVLKGRVRVTVFEDEHRKEVHSQRETNVYCIIPPHTFNEIRNISAYGVSACFLALYTPPPLPWEGAYQ